MSLPVWKPRVMMLSGNNPAAATSFQIGGSAVTGYQSFTGAGYANGDLVKYWAVAVDGSNVPTGAWEHGIGTIDTAATPDEIDRPATVIANSAGTTAKIDFSAATAVLLFVEPGATDVALAYAASRGHISGGVLAYNSATAIDVSACVLDVNGALASIAAGTFTSGTTMLDLAGAAVTLAASSAYYVFATSGGAFRFEKIDGTGDGAAPVWDADLNYWKAATTGATARRIGKFWTDGSGNILAFDQAGFGRSRMFTLRARDGISMLTAGTATAYTAITISPYYTADDDAGTFYVLPVATGATTQVSVFLSVDAGANDAFQAKINGASSTLSLGDCFVRLRASTLHYKVAGTNATGYVRAKGVEFTA